MYRGPMAGTPVFSVHPYASHDARWRLAPHAHAGVEIDLVAAGECVLSVPEQKPIGLRAGDAFVVPPGVPHGFIAGARGCAFHVAHVEGLPSTVIDALLNSDAQRQKGERQSPLRYPLPAAARSQFAHLVRAIDHELALARPLAAEAALALAIHLACLVVRGGAGLDAEPARSEGDRAWAHVQRALAAMDADDADDALSTDVATLAAGLHLSAAHLRRLFRKHLGVSPKAYLLQRRLTRARSLLLQTDLSVTEIALRLGYAMPHHFTEAFSRAEGAPPTAWRKDRRLPIRTPGARASLMGAPDARFS